MLTRLTKPTAMLALFVGSVAMRPALSEAQMPMCWQSLPPCLLPYSSKAGEELTILDVQGANTDRAMAPIQYTRENAKAVCEGEGHQESEELDKCIDEELTKSGFKDRVWANCKSGVFADYSGASFQFRGRSKRTRGAEGEYAEAEYQVYDIGNGKMLRGCYSCGYDQRIEIFRLLCPARVPRTR